MAKQNRYFNPPTPTPAPPLVAGGVAAAPVVDTTLDDDGFADIAPPAPAQDSVVPRGYRVKATKLVSMGCGMTHLVAGDVIHPEHYDPGVIERLRDAGVELEPVA